MISGGIEVNWFAYFRSKIWQWSENCSFPDLLQDLIPKLELDTQIRSFLNTFSQIHQKLFWGNGSLQNNVKECVRLCFPNQYLLVQISNSNTRKVCDMCSKLERRYQNEVSDLFWCILLISNIFHTFSCCFHSWCWASKSSYFGGSGNRQQMKNFIVYVK